LLAGLKPRDVAALAAAVDPSSTGFVDYKQFVGSLVESAPAHEKLLSTGKLGHETQHEKWGTSPITVSEGDGLCSCKQLGGSQRLWKDAKGWV